MSGFTAMEKAPLEPVDPRGFRDTLGRFATGVAVVTAASDAGPVGMAVNSFTSVSLEPPLVLFCAAHTSRTWPRIREAGSFGVSILGARQEAHCRQFAARSGDRFAGVGVVCGELGVPLISGALGHLEGTIVEVHRAGDHDVVIGGVVSLASSDDDRPLLFYRGGFSTLMDS